MLLTHCERYCTPAGAKRIRRAVRNLAPRGNGDLNGRVSGLILGGMVFRLDKDVNFR
jgi:hypothetical protein